MNPVMIIALLLLAVFVVTFLTTSAHSRGPTRAQRKAYDEAATLLSRAYGTESYGNPALAASQFGRALYYARLSGDAFSTSESLYGLARLRIKNSDGKAAIPLIEEALALEPQWYTSKPNFSQGMRQDLDKAKELATQQ